MILYGMVSKVTKSKPVKQVSKAVETAIDQLRPVPSSQPKFAPDSQGIRYWLIKSEPMKRIDAKTGKDVSFPMSELLKVEKESWDGVRNYEARNAMLQMSIGDKCLFYHSNCPVPGIVGVASVTELAKPDEKQFNSSSQYFDAKSTREKPRWWCVDVSFERRLRHKIKLVDLKANEKLQEFLLVKRGRLSVIPVSEEHYKLIMDLEKEGDVEDDIDCDIDRKLIKF